MQSLFCPPTWRQCKPPIVLYNLIFIVFLADMSFDLQSPSQVNSEMEKMKSRQHAGMLPSLSV